VYFESNNSVLFSGIECENNDYLWHSLTIDLNLCKISDKMLSNHNTTHTLNTYLSTAFGLNVGLKQHIKVI